MADPVAIAGTNTQGKLRNPLGVIGLSLITFGIYYFVWYYKTQKELAEIGRVRGTDELGTAPGTSLLAVTLGAFILVPPFVSLYKGCARLNAAERHTGLPEGMSGGLLFVLFVFISPVALYIYQDNLNKVLRAQAGAPAVGGMQQGAPAMP